MSKEELKTELFELERIIKNIENKDLRIDVLKHKLNLVKEKFDIIPEDELKSMIDNLKYDLLSFFDLIIY